MANCTDLKASGAGSGLKTDIFHWDVRNLPLRTASVDVVVTDLVSEFSALYLYILFQLCVFLMIPLVHAHIQTNIWWLLLLSLLERSKYNCNSLNISQSLSLTGVVER